MILAIDSSSLSASVALVRAETLVAESFLNVGLTHSQTLGPMISHLLEQSRMSWEDIEAIAVTNGPGSFTGLRIGAASALGLAEARGLPCLGVSSLRAAACNALDSNGLVQAVMDARRGQLYAALFEAKNGALTRLEPDAAVSRDELLEKRKDKPCLWVGDAAAVCAKALGQRTAARTLVSALGVALCAARGHTRPVTPLRYLRKPQAEREREARQGV